MAQGRIAQTQYSMQQGRLMISKLNELGNPTGFFHLGDVSSASIDLTEEVTDVYEHSSGARGLDAEFTKQLGAEFKASLSSFTPENFALFMRAAVVAKAAGSITDESITLFSGLESYTNNIDISSVVVKSPDGLTTYVAGDDYIANDNSIEPVTGGAIELLDTGDGVPVKVSYSYGAQSAVDAFTEAKGYYRLIFDGIDTAQSNKKRKYTLRRVSTSVLKSLALIADDPNKMDIDGKCLIDNTATTRSKYVNIDIEA